MKTENQNNEPVEQTVEQKVEQVVESIAPELPPAVRETVVEKVTEVLPLNPTVQEIKAEVKEILTEMERPAEPITGGIRGESKKDKDWDTLIYIIAGVLAAVAIYYLTTLYSKSTDENQNTPA
jgi:hypothetical protein